MTGMTAHLDLTVRERDLLTFARCQRIQTLVQRFEDVRQELMAEVAKFPEIPADEEQDLIETLHDASVVVDVVYSRSSGIAEGIRTRARMSEREVEE